MRDGADVARERGFYDFGPERNAFEALWTEDNYRDLTELLEGMPVHWRFFLKHRMFEAVADDTDIEAGPMLSIRERFEKMVSEYPELSNSLG